MFNQELLEKILKLEGAGISKQTSDYVLKSTKLKIIGDVNQEIFFYTQNSFSEKILERNAFQLKQQYKNITGKFPSHIYINNKKIEVEIKELLNSNSMNDLKINNFQNDKNKNIGSDEKYGSIFSYDSSFLNKKKIIIKMHNDFLGKYWEKEINTNIINNPFMIFKKKKLINNLKSLKAIKYKSYSTDTEELLKYLNIF